MSIKDISVHERGKGKFNTRYDYTEVVISRRIELVSAAKMAVEMATRLAMIAIYPDGEDTSGRQQFRMQEPTELAKRACDAAAALWAEFESRDWLVELPEPKHIEHKEEKEPA